MAKSILVIAGDGIGTEIMAQAVRVLGHIVETQGLDLEIHHGLAGGCAIDTTGEPLPQATLDLAGRCDAVLLGAIGGPKWDGLEHAKRPERALLGLRSELQLFANLRPIVLNQHLVGSSSLRPEVINGLDLMIVRELTGGIYFGEPRGIRTNDKGEREGFNTLVYSESEVERIARVGFDMAMRRGRRLCSVDKANVLEATILWREVVSQVATDYPDVELSHMYTDNAAMQLVRAPTQFDVVLTTNMFGDILSDLASMATGSLGMLPSASLDASGKGMFEPCHGSAPDIAGQGIANPLATILSVAMIFRYSFDDETTAERIEAAVDAALRRGLRTADIAAQSDQAVGTIDMGDAVLEELGG